MPLRGKERRKTRRERKRMMEHDDFSEDDYLTDSDEELEPLTEELVRFYTSLPHHLGAYGKCILLSVFLCGEVM